MRRRVKTVVKESESGMLILDFLVERYRFKDETDWLAVLCGKGVMLNGAPAEKSEVLKPGDEILYEAPEAPEPDVDRNISVIYEDEHLIAVNKSGNLPCHPSGCYLENTLVGILKESHGLTDLHLINRLDRETSGVILVAKNPAAAKKLSNQFLKHRVQKFYSVIVEGDFPVELCASGWLMNDAASAVRKKRCFVSGTRDAPPARDAEWAETRFELIQHCGALSVVNVELMTGRLHQIRATLCSIGYPVVGDKMYGVDEGMFIRFINDQLSVEDGVRLRMGRQALHARELRVKHPVTAEPLVLSAPMPEDMRALC